MFTSKEDCIHKGICLPRTQVAVMNVKKILLCILINLLVYGEKTFSLLVLSQEWSYCCPLYLLVIKKTREKESLWRLSFMLLLFLTCSVTFFFLLFVMMTTESIVGTNAKNELRDDEGSIMTFMRLATVSSLREVPSSTSVFMKDETKH